MSYTIDVYKKKIKPTNDIVAFSAFISFFPQLVAGPIERAKNLLPQFNSARKFDYAESVKGLKIIAMGMFKKVVIADRLAIFVNQVYDNPVEHDGLALIIATVFFSFQIYCDFSGYSDIAIGTAKILGFDLMNNFNRPYFSRNIAEFWRRWHISLSTWLRDYIFLPLSYSISRKLTRESYFHIRTENVIYLYSTIITFILCGLWHGASWTFVAWGALNGFYLLFGKWTRNYQEKIIKNLGLYKDHKGVKYFHVLSTFSLICLAWIFFRAKSLSDSWYIITHLFKGFSNIFNIIYIKNTIDGLGLSESEFVIAIIAIIIMEIIHAIQDRNKLWLELSHKPVWVRWCLYYSIIFLIIYFGIFEKIDFIYFQF